MSNHKRPRTQPTERGAWLRCEDCASVVCEVMYGRPPRATLSIEVEHSDSCPAWRHDGREVAVAFLPPRQEPTP